MSQIDYTTIYLLIVFVLPGFLAYLVTGSLYRQANQDSEIVITYKSLLNSAIIYAIVYVGFDTAGYSLSAYIKRHDIYTILILLLTSAVWGIIHFKFKEQNYLVKALSRLHFLNARVQPPNLYAALLDPKFQPKAEMGYWIIFSKNGVTYEGYVKYTDVAGSERLAYVTEVKELDGDGQVQMEHAPTYGMVLDLTKLESLEIIYGD